MTLDDMYQIATTTQREAGIKTSQSIAAIKHNKDRFSEDKEVTAFQKQKFGKASDQKKKLQTKHFTPQTGPGNNSNCNGKYCFYCKTPEPHQGRMIQKDPREQTVQRQTKMHLLALSVRDQQQ